MKYLLDTNICIYTIRRRPEEVFRRVEACRIGDIGISSMTYSELCYGVSKSQVVRRNRAALERFVAPLEILEFGVEAALACGEVRAALEKKGSPIGPMDLLIGAHALAAGCVLVTNNTREFERIPELRVEDWVAAG
ncbi:type II toxin-antitoxin system VapC family toxin [Pelagicoccus enzymogenes]|uniref:type II toxin-antitoxin system tRNA(fMet)-specific endonuclease VapC n=1 Tax=Pelagicoccus enzymogenes TaxID=2773457 RepID=UPI00280C54A9|nr:type II toxin-antitoxin system VapC family toxin [Pelagicoccus enzymogenes]MDQ8199792.1 type II toxin-antitoxin system VapC family toxin [Pelagicoccus enzymogenes]